MLNGNAKSLYLDVQYVQEDFSSYLVRFDPATEDTEETRDLTADETDVYLIVEESKLMRPASLPVNGSPSEKESVRNHKVNRVREQNRVKDDGYLQIEKIVGVDLEKGLVHVVLQSKGMEGTERFWVRSGQIAIYDSGKERFDSLQRIGDLEEYGIKSNTKN